MSQDRELDKYLEGKSALSRLYADSPEIELPGHLDAAILAEAHRATKSRPGAKPKRHWTIPLGMAATLFIAVMIGLQLPYILKESAQPEKYKQERAAAMMDKNVAEFSSAASDERRNIYGLAKEKSERLRAIPTPRLEEDEAPVALYAPAPVSPPVAMPPPARAIEAKRMKLNKRAVTDNGEVSAKEEIAAGHAEGKLSDSVELEPAAATIAAHPNRSLMQPLNEEASEANLAPADWLVRIRRLKQEGRLEDAKQELAAFKKRYPEYPVPREIEFR